MSRSPAHATPSDSAVCPAMQLQSPTPVLAKDELVPEGHAQHAPVPVTAVYVAQDSNYIVTGSNGVTQAQVHPQPSTLNPRSQTVNPNP